MVLVSCRGVDDEPSVIELRDECASFSLTSVFCCLQSTGMLRACSYYYMRLVIVVWEMLII